MIYFKLNTQSFIDTFLRLEEISFLKTIINDDCSILNNSSQSHLFDLSEFSICEFIPEDIIRCNISDCVCLFDSDIYSVDGGEFLFYYPEQKGNFFRLDKFKYQDFEVIITMNNIAENKYFVSDNNLYKKSLKNGLSFDICPELFSKYAYLKETIKDIPLLLLNNIDPETKCNFNFEECYYVGKYNNFLSNNNLVGHNLSSILKDYNISHEQLDPNFLIYVCSDCFSQIYGEFDNDLFNVILKRRYKLDPSYQPKIITKDTIVDIKDFEMQDFDSTKNFPFSRKNILCNRSSLINKIRLNFFVDNFGN